jgi:Major Facilitator Superfamily
MPTKAKIRTATTKKLVASSVRVPDAPGLFGGILHGRAKLSPPPSCDEVRSETLARIAAASLRVVDACTQRIRWPLEELTPKQRVIGGSAEIPQFAFPLARLTPVQWLVCSVAALGFAFDLYETLVLPLIVRPALAALGNFELGSPGYNLWVGLLFYLPLASGGVFGLLGGYLTDLLGRRRVLVWSILLYAFSACAASFALTLPQLLFFRCTTVIGVCVEYVAGVAWVAELFPISKQRESVLGYTQAAFGLGGLMVTGAYYVAVTYAERFPAIHGSHEAWRYTLLSGLIPAIPLILARPFLPESPIWQEKESKGTLKPPSFDHVGHYIPGGVQLCPGFRGHSADNSHGSWPSRSTELRASRAGANREWRAIVSGARHDCGPLAVCLPSGPDRDAEAPPAPLPGPWIDRLLLPLLFLRDAQFTARQVRGFSRGSPVERAVQPLGQLFAANVPDALARHRREFRNQHRSPGDRCIGRAFHDTTRQHHARCQYGRSPCILGRHACRPRIHWVANREFLAA